MEENEKKVTVHKKSTRDNKLSTSSAIIVAGLLIAGGLFFGLNSGNTNLGNKQVLQTDKQQPQPQQPGKQDVDITKVNIKGEPFIGNPNAPVVMAYWSDYQCPFCKRFDTNTITPVISDYVNKGKVKIVFKDFQFLGPDSQTAGVIARAVWDVAPNKYYIFHKAMYEKQDGENSGWGKKEDILTLVKKLGIDSVKVKKLATVNEAKYLKIINNNKIEGSKFGINGTPGTIIGKNLVVGAQPYATVKQLIDIELKGK